MEALKTTGDYVVIKLGLVWGSLKVEEHPKHGVLKEPAAW